MAICAVVAHFIDKDLRNRSTLIGMRRVKESHSGENIAEAVVAVVMEVAIVLNIGTNEVVSNLGVFTTDNAPTKWMLPSELT